MDTKQFRSLVTDIVQENKDILALGSLLERLRFKGSASRYQCLSRK
jgi:hypothetical protein